METKTVHDHTSRVETPHIMFSHLIPLGITDVVVEN